MTSLISILRMRAVKEEALFEEVGVGGVAVAGESVEAPEVTTPKENFEDPGGTLGNLEAPIVTRKSSVTQAPTGLTYMCIYLYGHV